MEDDLAKHARELSEKFHGLTSHKCHKLAYEKALQNNIAIPNFWLINKFSDDNLVTVMDTKDFFQIEYITWMKQVYNHAKLQAICDDDLSNVETSEGDCVLVRFTGKENSLLCWTYGEYRWHYWRTRRKVFEKRSHPIGVAHATQFEGEADKWKSMRKIATAIFVFPDAESLAYFSYFGARGPNVVTTKSGGLWDLYRDMHPFALFLDSYRFGACTIRRSWLNIAFTSEINVFLSFHRNVFSVRLTYDTTKTIE